MPGRAEFPKCAARSQKKMRAFEAKGDFAHSAARHVCDDCRCPDTAGLQTSDDFYTIEGVGHYGVGFCYVHEVQGNRNASLEYARKQFEAMKQHGKLMAANTDVPDSTSTELMERTVAGGDVVDLGHVAQIRGARNIVHNMLQNMMTILDGGSKTPCEILEELQELRRVITEQGAPDDFIEHVDGIIFSEGTMTEKCGKGSMRMTDATKIDAISKTARTLSAIGMDEFKATEHEYCEKRDVAIKLTQTVNGIGKYLAEHLGDEQADKLKKGITDDVLMDIWMDV
jgi:hypothetical protein